MIVYADLLLVMGTIAQMAVLHTRRLTWNTVHICVQIVTLTDATALLTAAGSSMILRYVPGLPY